MLCGIAVNVTNVEHLLSKFSTVKNGAQSAANTNGINRTDGFGELHRHIAQNMGRRCVMQIVTLDLREGAHSGNGTITLPEGSRLVLKEVIEDPEASAHQKAYEVWRMVDDLFWVCLKGNVRITDVFLPEDWPEEVKILATAALSPMFRVRTRAKAQTKPAPVPF